MKLNIKYKNIDLVKDEECNSIEFIANKQTLKNVESYINIITLIAEYAEIKSPEFIVFNKSNTSYELSAEIMNYTKSIIFTQLKTWGIKKVLMVVKESAYIKKYHNIEKKEPFIKSFISVDEAYEWMKRNGKNTSHPTVASDSNIEPI